MEMIDKIVNKEWDLFQKVQNEGGRAACQDDWKTFQLMRKSQFLCWNYKLLDSYYNDILKAESQNRNLVTEKYARMMASTAPEEYAKLQDSLPALTSEMQSLAEGIISIQVSWREDFALNYPHMSSNSRLIHTSDDQPYETSFETYLRGELLTYSFNTLVLYGKMVISYHEKGQSLTNAIMGHVAKAYGYASLEDAEAKLGSS